MEQPTSQSHHNTQPKVEEVSHGSHGYQVMLQARNRILRQPLGLQLTEKDTLGEDTQRHFGLFMGDLLVGGVIANQQTPETTQLRQMWIEPNCANRGLGRLLLEEVLTKLAQESTEMVVLHARVPVLEFYRKCGFKSEGDSFIEVGIPHRRMKLTISPETRSLGDHQ